MVLKNKGMDSGISAEQVFNVCSVVGVGVLHVGIDRIRDRRYRAVARILS